MTAAAAPDQDSQTDSLGVYAATPERNFRQLTVPLAILADADAGEVVRVWRCVDKLEVVLTPIMHDTAGELAQPFDVKEWRKGECELIPGTLQHLRLGEHIEHARGQHLGAGDLTFMRNGGTAHQRCTLRHIRHAIKTC